MTSFFRILWGVWCALFVISVGSAFATPLDMLSAAQKAENWRSVLRQADIFWKEAAVQKDDPEKNQPDEATQLLVCLAQIQAALAIDSPSLALRAAGKALQLDRNNVQVWFLQGDALVQAGQLAKAEKAYHTVLSLCDKKSDWGWMACRRLASVAQARGDFVGVLEWFQKAVTYNETDAILHMEHALALHKFGFHTKAEKVITSASMLAPDVPAIWNNRGMIRLAQGKYPEALEDFSKAIQLDAENQQALLNRGNVLRVLKRYEESLADFTTALTLHPDSVKLYVGRMYTRLELGQFAEAKADLERAMPYGSIDPYLLNEFAWFLATVPDALVRDGKRAVEYAEQAIMFDAYPVPVHYDTLAAAYAETGNFEKALAAQQEALMLGQQAGVSSETMASWEKRRTLYENWQPYRYVAP